MRKEFEISYDEIEELIGIIHSVYGFDFGGYSKASLKRRITRIMNLKSHTYFDLRTNLVNDSDFFEYFLLEVTVNVTEMFRDPSFYHAVRALVIPYMLSFPRVKIWSAGCSTGEELYSLAIVLQEEGVLRRSFLYGTDINSRVVDSARKGIYNLGKMKLYTENYLASGGTHIFSDYYTARYDAASIIHELKKNTLFSVHNLISDGVFNEFQLITCRNVLIYFNRELQRKVLRLFYDSLCLFGFLCLGSKESLHQSELAGRFKVIDKKENIYQKIV